jgi:hypothetical protein
MWEILCEFYVQTRAPLIVDEFDFTGKECSALEKKGFAVTTEHENGYLLVIPKGLSIHVGDDYEPVSYYACKGH